MDADVAELVAAFSKLHGARASHRETVHVHLEHQGAVAWDGEVEVFDLADHPRAATGYGWAHASDAPGRKRFVAVLGDGPVTSPERAVQAAIVNEYRSRQK